MVSCHLDFTEKYNRDFKKYVQIGTNMRTTVKISCCKTEVSSFNLWQLKESEITTDRISFFHKITVV